MYLDRISISTFIIIVIRMLVSIYTYTIQVIPFKVQPNMHRCCFMLFQNLFLWLIMYQNILMIHCTALDVPIRQFCQTFVGVFILIASHFTRPASVCSKNECHRVGFCHTLQVCQPCNLHTLKGAVSLVHLCFTFIRMETKI